MSWLSSAVKSVFGGGGGGSTTVSTPQSTTSSVTVNPVTNVTVTPPDIHTEELAKEISSLVSSLETQQSKDIQDLTGKFASLVALEKVLNKEETKNEEANVEKNTAIADLNVQKQMVFWMAAGVLLSIFMGMKRS